MNTNKKIQLVMRALTPSLTVKRARQAAAAATLATLCAGAAWHGSVAAQNASRPAASAVQQLTQAVDEVQRLTLELRKGVNDARRQQLQTQLRKALAIANEAAKQAKTELAGGRAQLQRLGMPAALLGRHDQVQAEFDKRVQEFERAAGGAATVLGEPQLREFDQFFQRYPASGRTAKNNSLTWGPRKPQRQPDEKGNEKAETAARPVQLGNVEQTRAAAASLVTIGGVRFSIPPQPEAAPQDADLAETPEVQLSADIRAKAAELGNNPVAISNWVHSNVQYVPSWGALQSSQATLKSLRGNAIDTASLHIALLRAAGIPARYQFGTVEIDAQRAMNWLGGLRQAQAVLDLLAQGGIAARGVSDNGQITAIRMEHAWVSAYVNWAPSRGARQGGWDLTPPQHPHPNAGLNAWVPLDGSFKQRAHADGLNLGELAPLNVQGVFDEAKAGATCTAASASQLQLNALAASRDRFKTQAQAQLTATAAGLRVGEVLGSSQTVITNRPMLAGTLAMPVISQGDTVAALPAALRTQVQLSLFSGTNQVLGLNKPLSELAGASLVLSFVPETTADADALALLLRPGTGGDAATGLPSRIPAYLIRVKAQLRLQDQLVGEGGSFSLGETLSLRTALTGGNEPAAAGAESVITAGETHAWAIQAHGLDAATPAGTAQQLAALRSQLNGATLPNAGTQSGELLRGVALAYQAQLDAAARLSGRVAGVAQARLPGLVRASSRLQAEMAFGVVMHVRAAGIGLHVDRHASAAATRAAQGAASGYLQQSLERASGNAHQMLNQVFGEGLPGAQSAVAAIAQAAQTGPVLRADAQTLAQTLAALDTQSTVREPLEQAIANGQQALVLAQASGLGGQAMDPLVLHDAASGAATYQVTARELPNVSLTAQRAGLAGWLGLADAAASRVIALPALDALAPRLNTAQTLLGDIDNVSWPAFAGRDEIVDGLFLSRLQGRANTADACDWILSIVAGELGAGLPPSDRVNRAPVITSAPVQLAPAGQPYTYAVQATDADGDALAYSLAASPTGMSINAAGLVQWPQPVAGSFPVTVVVSDGIAQAQQSWQLVVGDAAGGLQLNISLSPSIAEAGQTVQLFVSAGSSAGAVTRTATMGGVPLVLDATGRAVFTAPASGAHPIVVTANDGRASRTREAVLTVRDASDTAAPVAAILTPERDDSLRGLVTVTGTATDARFAYYQLLLRPLGASDYAWTEIARGLAPVANGALGQVDTSRHANGLYQIGLRVVDVNGQESTAGVTVEFLGNLKLGQFRLSFTDIRAEAPGMPLVLTRTYDSSKKDVLGDFGWGWSATSQDLSVRKNMTFGLSWEVQTRGLQLCIVPVGKRRVSITLPDGAMHRFDAANSPECQSFQAPAVNIVFNPVPGPTGGAAGRANAGAQLRVVDGALVQAQGGHLVDTDSGLPWNPLDFELTTEEGLKYRLREGVGVQSVTDAYGHKTTYEPGGVKHSAGPTVTLQRDTFGRIVVATDPAGGSVAYQYNASGELESVTARDGKTTKFGYASVGGANGGATSGNQDHNHLLSSITDPKGQVVMSNQFDEYGRLTGSADALGQASQQQFDLAANRQTVTDRRGNKTVYTFDADGNITRAVNALGQTSTYTYDANGNETSVTNALGHKTERTFDPDTGKQLTEKNALGQTVSTQYRTGGQAWQRLNPLGTTDARNNATAYGYDDDRQPGATPKSITEPLGRVTELTQHAATGNLIGLNIAGEAIGYQYDSLGRKTQETNGLGQVTRYAYDAAGNETQKTVVKSVNGQTVSLVTTRVYDAENRITEETDPLGGKRTTAYDAAGKVQSQTDSLGRRTSYVYDANTRLIRTDYPDATNEQTGYDAEGNETTRTDRQGRVTRMDYDALNRLTKTTYPDGTSETTEYDAAGRVTATTDRRGQRATMEYDDAGRQTASVDATGRRTSQTYDANGNRLTITVDGRTTSYEYDALNRLTKTTWADGSTHSSVYRPDNRKQSETDSRGVRTSYGYDAAGRLTSVSQSLSQTATATTAYGYDETGAKVSQVDALGRTTTWTIDGNGRITSRKIQDGTTETSQYDLEGNRLSHRRFDGSTITYQYNSQNRMTAAIVPAGTGPNAGIAGSAIASSYGANGQLTSQQEQGVNSLNGTQSWQYDANDRLIGTQSPVGRIDWQLDGNGNIVERSASQGQVNAGTVKMEYDAAGRISKVTAQDGKVTTYGYDAAGRLTTTDRQLNNANGQAQSIVTHQRYDSADRQVAVAHIRKTANGDALVAAQGIIRSAGGAINRIDTYREGGGASFDPATGTFAGTATTSVGYEYDGNARLTREAKANEDVRYEYDAAGNRTKKTVATAADTVVTTYAYDSADRLKTETVNATAGTTTISYLWDGNGNLSTKLEQNRATLYRWDANNKLIDIRTGATQAEAQAASPSVSYGYDAQGNRVRRSTKTGSSPDQIRTTSYLIDSNQEYAQVAMETAVDGTGTNSMSYLWANGLVRQAKVNGTVDQDLFPLKGHLNTSLGAVDANGNVAETTNADAFGNLEQLAGGKQTHIYTGEYADQDSQLIYLRARWYDPKTGQFVSADPFEGKQSDPRSLNRYVYAHSNPMHFTDPSGEISLGEIGSALSNVASMASRAYNTYDTINSFLGGDENGSFGLVDALVGHLMTSLAGSSDGGVDQSQALVGAALSLGTHGHHTIPKYTCGHENQNLIKLGIWDHTVLHAKLYLFSTTVDLMGKAYHVAFKRKPKGKPSPIKSLGSSPTGRGVIGAALTTFYNRGWWTKGSGDTKGIFGRSATLGQVFSTERRYFIHHFNSSCK